MKTHPCDIYTMTAEQAWGNIGGALDCASRSHMGYHRNYWFEIAKRSADVWFERTDNRLVAKYPLLARRNKLDHTAKGLAR